MANEKHIFIGLGGAGCQTVSKIKEKVYEKRFKNETAAKSRMQQMNDSYRFLFIDTDQRDIDEANRRNRESFEKGRVPFISTQSDLINLGQANPQAIYYEAKSAPDVLINKRILEGCSREVAAKIPDQPLAFGAGAFRMKSRIAFAHALTNFQEKLQTAISGLNDVKTVGGEDCIIFYWVVCSTLGGTGSGIVNDVLYHVNQLHNQIVGNGDPQLVLTMYMPKVYIDCNATEEKYSLNAFGVFKEMEALKEMSYDLRRNTLMHRLAFQKDYSLIDNERRYCPFYYLIPVDVQTDKGTSLGDTQTMYRNTAEMLYHVHNSAAGAAFRSDIDNYINDIMERDHHDFLVPMGYVSLQKPEEQMRKYMHARLRRDLLRDWLLNENHSFPEEQAARMADSLFEQLGSGSGSLGARLTQSSDLESALQSQNYENAELNQDLDFDTILGYVENVRSNLNRYAKGENREHLVSVMKDALWDKAENLIREHGIIYAQDAFDAVRRHVVEQLESDRQNANDRKALLNEMEAEVRDKFEDAKKIDWKERTKIADNRDDIREYTTKLEEYVALAIDIAMQDWADDIKKELCLDERNSEMAVIKAALQKVRGKAAEMSREASELYSIKLPNQFGDASLDVTTVYLPQLKNICDANGWIPDNFFGRLYNLVVPSSRDKQESAIRQSLAKLIDDEVYNSQDPGVNKALAAGQYVYSFDGEVDKRSKKKAEPTIRTRFFTNPVLADRMSEKLIEDFLAIASDVFDRRLRNDKEAQGRWYEQKVSDFFADLTNMEKDEVRRSLNPALFFSYNSNRIGTTNKEEHLVFVAPNRTLAHDMLGFQTGNPRHRFVEGGDENTALVLKSKYGLALEDYRIYDSLRTVYEKASFREKYHFHHSFAQHLDKLSASDLPEEVLPQHHTLAKMMLLNKFDDETKSLFHADEFEPENFTTMMLLTNASNNQYISVALPEAFSVIDGRPALRLRNKSRKLYLEIEGCDLAAQFERFSRCYHNYRFGETFDNLLSALLTSVAPSADGHNGRNGEEILKDSYPARHHKLLEELMASSRSAQSPEASRLYLTLFGLLKEKYPTVHDFIR